MKDARVRPVRFHMVILLALAWGMTGWWVGACRAEGLKISTEEKGVKVDAGPRGGLVLQYPVLLNAKHKTAHAVTEKQVTEAGCTLKYAGGAKVVVKAGAGGAVSLSFSGMPADVKSFTIQSLVSFKYNDGGTFQTAGSKETPFPKEKPDKPHLVQKNTSSLTLKDQDNNYFRLQFPPATYVELTDNREWNWKTYELKATTFYNPDVKTYTLHVFDTPANGEKPATTEGAAGSAFKVDRFGQNARMDFPQKVKSEAELKADVEADKAYYASFNPPAVDEYGGLPGSGDRFGLKKTGFFHVQQAKVGDKTRWFMVDPAGNAFFHLGICCFSSGFNMTYVKGRENIYEWLPPDEEPWKGVFHPQHGTDWVSFLACNIVRKYGKPFDGEEFAARMIDRVRKFGFNSGGAFGSPDKTAREAAHFPYVSSLPLSQWPNLPRLPGVRETFDPFDAKIRTQIEKNFAKTLPGNANNPLCIGYFITNEPLYEDVPRVLPTLSGKYACKREFVKSLEAKYPAIGDFNKAWNLKAESFEALNDQGLAVTTPQAAADVQAFMGVFFDTYYKLLADTFHKYDTNHMLLGNRFQAGTINNEQLCRIAGKYLDVMSFNYYTTAIDKAFMERIYSWTGRPMILSEFYYDSPSDSGLRGGVKDVKSQQERGLGYRNYIEQTASLDFIVGAEWYTLTDASTTGVAYAKYGGENPNSGLFSNVDRPWKPMIAEMVKTNYAIYPIMLGEKAPFAWDDPRFAVKQSANKQLTIYRAAGTVKMDGTAAGFPGMPAEQISGQRLVVGTDAGGLEASFKVCWDDANLYALVNVTDSTPMKNKATGAGLWAGDAVELFIGAGQVDQDGMTLYSDRHFLLGAGLDEAGQPRWHLVNSKSQPVCRVVVVPNVDGKGYTLEAAIPFDALGFVPKAGQTVRFDMGVDDSATGGRRLRQIMWNGNERNSTDRTAWGRAVFGQ